MLFMSEIVFIVYLVVALFFASYFYNMAMASDMNKLGKITAFLWGFVGWNIGIFLTFVIGMSIIQIFKL